ncbi:MAG TPA: hypothetical protein VFV79_11165 [Saprospiraceae bacterium]|nr:hypothetical protein [Saprospiraceae bacterium]
MYNIHLLPASFGDAILIEYGEQTINYILIDGGPYFNVEEMVKGLKKVAPDLTSLELLVISHIDIDHIDGIITLLNQDELPFEIREVWFNGYKQLKEAEDLLGPLQGEYLSLRIKANQIPHNLSFGGGPVVIQDYNALPEVKLPGGMKITLVNPGLKALVKLGEKWSTVLDEIGDEEKIEKRFASDLRYDEEIDDLLGDEPTMEDLQTGTIPGDKSEANLSSIAFIGEYEEKTCLFAADAPSDSILPAIESLILPTGRDTLKLNAWKLAHHGSKKSTLNKLMEKLACKHILVSSNGKRYKHPDPETIARIIGINGPDVHFYFNYPTSFNHRWSDGDTQEQYHFKSWYPEENATGITIKL